jgi:hypothetical protein
MPRDDFTRLERRWRKRPLFLPRRRHLPISPGLVLLVALGGVLASALFGVKPLADLTAAVRQAFNASASPFATQEDKAPSSAATAEARQVGNAGP